MSMITEQVERLREEADIVEFTHEFTAKMLRVAADTIEQLAAKVREDNASQKALEDIRKEIIKWIEMGGGNYDYDSGLNRALSIIDKHNPAKMKSEGKE